MSDKYYCPLLNKDISEGKCLDINYELIKAKTEEYLPDIRRIRNNDNAEIEEICKNCPHYPL